MAYKTGSKLPRTAADLNTGTQWLGYTNLTIGGEANYYANVPGAGWLPSLTELRLVLDATTYTDKSSGGTASATVSGNPTFWGISGLTTAQIKSSGFGFQVKHDTFDTIRVTNFDLSLIPDSATITNISVTYYVYTTNIGGGDAKLYTGGHAMEITFTYPEVLSASGWNEGSLIAEIPNPYEMETELRYSAYDKNRNFLGEYRRVVSNVSIKRNINQLHSSMQIELGQNDTTEEQSLASLLTEAGDNYLTEEDAQWLAELSVAVGVGTGTSTDTNVEVDVYASYGMWALWVAEDGTAIITEDNRAIIVGDGAPDGRKIYGGYISSWELEIGGEETVNPMLLSHSQELSNIMLETVDTPSGLAYLNSNGVVRLKSQLINGTFMAGQSFTMNANQTIAGIGIWAKCNLATNVTITLRTGTSPTGGSVIASGVVPVSVNAKESLIFLPFDVPVALTNASTYTYTIDSSSIYQSGKSGTEGYPLEIAVDWSAGYTGGDGKWEGYPYLTWYDGVFVPGGTLTPFDMKFVLYVAGGNTTVTMNSVDPSFALKQVLSFAQSQGSRVKFSDQTIDMTGTVVSLKFKSNFIDDAVDACLSAMPTDWYVYYDPATDEVHAHKRPTQVTRTFYAGRDLVGKLKLKKSIEKLVNDVYFSGGDTGGGSNLLIRRTDATSITSIRRGALKMSDNRVTDPVTAAILADAQIGRYKSPIYSGTCTVRRSDALMLEQLNLGEVIQYGNLGTVVSGIALQIVAINYKVETADLQLNVLLPQISKRVEDIRRNLALQESENDPVVPS